MKSLRLPIFMLAAGLLTGCESIRELDNAALEWSRAQRQESATTSTRQKQSCQAVNEIFTVSGVGVDTSYLRLKRYFGLMTLDERTVRFPGGVYAADVRASAFRHESLPGVRYWMNDEITLESWKPEWGMRQADVWMSVHVERDGSGSLIELDYCIGGNSGFIGGPGFRAKLKAGVLSAAKGRRGS